MLWQLWGFWQICTVTMSYLLIVNSAIGLLMKKINRNLKNKQNLNFTQTE